MKPWDTLCSRDCNSCGKCHMDTGVNEYTMKIGQLPDGKWYWTYLECPTGETKYSDGYEDELTALAHMTKIIKAVKKARS